MEPHLGGLQLVSDRIFSRPLRCRRGLHADRRQHADRDARHRAAGAENQQPRARNDLELVCQSAPAKQQQAANRDREQRPEPGLRYGACVGPKNRTNADVHAAGVDLRIGARDRRARCVVRIAIENQRIVQRYEKRERISLCRASDWEGGMVAIHKSAVVGGCGHSRWQIATLRRISAGRTWVEQPNVGGGIDRRASWK